MEREEKIQLGLAAGAVAAFLLGFRRAAGAVVLYDGYRAYKQKNNAHAAFSGVVGTAFLVFPTWPDAAAQLARDTFSAPNRSAAKLPPPAPIANYASLTQPSGGDELWMGNWTLFDVADTQSPEIAAKSRSLKPGDTAALVLGQPGAPPMVFKARVIPGGPAGRYTAQWLTGPPVSGPQMAEFAAHHYLSA